MNTKNKFTKIVLEIISFFFAVTMLFTMAGCTDDDADELSTPELNINWNDVNESIDSTILSSYGYYIEDDYKASEKEFDSVSLCNYDPDDANAWKKTEYQLVITYGLNFKNSDGYHDCPTIEIALNETGKKGYYTATYKENGEFIEDDGKWFLSEDKETFLKEKVEDAIEIFGLEG